MDKIRLGRTGLMVSRSGFGAIPIQRIGFDESTALLRRAFEGGINFFDTAYGYSDSEEKIGRALSGERRNIVIATKTPAADAKTLHEHLELSLSRLESDYIDVYQLHNPKTMPKPGEKSGLYEALAEVKRKGLVRFIGISNHRLPVAREAIESGLYDTLQFPFSSLSSEADLELVRAARARDIGFIAMKGLSGGLITNAASTFAFIRSTEHAVPSGASSGSRSSRSFSPSRRIPRPWTARCKRSSTRTGPSLQGRSAAAADTACPAPPASR